MAWWLTNLISIHEHMGSIPGLLSGHCHELWCRSQTWLRSWVAVAVVQAVVVPIQSLAWEPPHDISIHYIDLLIYIHVYIDFVY